VYNFLGLMWHKMPESGGTQSPEYPQLMHKDLLMFKNIQPLFFLVRLFLAVNFLFLSSTFVCSNEYQEFTYSVHFIDVGQGDAIYISTPKKNLLVDGGNKNSGVVEYLQALKIDTIHYVIGTHPHADHIGGLISVFDAFTVVEAIDPGVVHTTNTFNDYLTAIYESDVTFTVGRKEMKWQLSENAYFYILHPANPSQRQLNDASIVSRLVLGDVSVLLTGDAQKRSEKEILSAGQTLNSQILKVGHHGSNTSTSDKFLRAINPEVSVLMVGEGNQYRHPHQETIDLLHDFGTIVFRTDIHGSIIIKSDGYEYIVKTSN